MKDTATKNYHEISKFCLKQLLLFMFAYILLVSCQNRSTDKEYRINPIHASNKELMLSEISGNISYIVLSTEHLLGHIMNIEFNDSLIFVASVRNPLYVFDADDCEIERMKRKNSKFQVPCYALFNLKPELSLRNQRSAAEINL